MIPRPPRSTRTDTLFPYTTLFRSAAAPASTGARPLYKDANASIESRVDDLLSRMTLEEKIAQITAVWTEKVRIFDDSLQLDPSKLAQRFPHGMGQFTRPSDAKGAFSPREIPRSEEHTSELPSLIRI